MSMRLTLFIVLLLGTATVCLPQGDSLLLHKNYNGMKYPDFAKNIALDLGIKLMSNSSMSDSLVVRQEKEAMLLGDVLRASFIGTRFSFYVYSPEIVVVLDD